MARVGLLYSEAEKVFIRLIMSGEPLSVGKAREIAKTGSNSTWQKYLNKFKEELSAKKLTSLPDSLPDSLIPDIEALWFKACLFADEQYTKDKQNLTETIDVLTAKNEEQSNTIEHKATEIANNEQLICELRATIDDLNELLKRSRLELSNTELASKNLSSELNQAKTEIEYKTREIHQLKHSLDEEKNRSEQASARWQGLYEKGQLEISEARQELHKDQATIQRLNAQVINLVEEVEKSEAKSEELVSDLAKVDAKLEKSFKQLDGAKNQLVKQEQQHTKNVAKLNADISSSKSKLEKENETLREQLSVTESKVNQIELILNILKSKDPELHALVIKSF